MADLRLTYFEEVLWLDEMSENYDSGAAENGGDEIGSPRGAGDSVTTVEPVEVIGMVNGTVDQVNCNGQQLFFVIHLYILFYSR